MKQKNFLSRFKVPIFTIIFVLLMIFNVSKASNELQAEAITTPTTLSIYDKVKVANKNYTVIGTGSDVKLLADASEGDSLTWNAAQAKLTELPTSYGTLANNILTDKFKQPTTTDLASFKVEDALNSSIPTMTNNWWLGDASVDNRSKYITANNNSYIGKNKIEDTDAGGATCAIKETEEIGILPTVDEVGAEEVQIIDYDKVVMEVSVLEAVNLDTNKALPRGYDYSGANIIFSTDAKCASGGNTQYYASHWLNSPSFGKQYIAISKNGDIFFSNKPDQSGYNWIQAYSQKNNYVSSDVHFKIDLFVPIRHIIDIGVNEFVPKKGDIFQRVINKNICTKSDVSANLGQEDEKAHYASNISSNNIRGKVKIDNITNADPIYGNTCPGQPHSAGTASLRPMITLPNNQILYNNTIKRTYDKVIQLVDSLPTSDAEGSYLTLLSPDLKAELNPLNENVKDNVLSIGFDRTDTVITIPVSVKDVKEGESFVSVSTKDKDGKDVYGVIGSVNGTQANLSLNVANLLNEGDRTLNLTLYQEDSGSHDTAYMSEGTPITVKLLSPQSIAFDEGQATSMAYGDTITLTSSLKSGIGIQANTDITYKINAGHGEVVSQSYDKATGKATAVIKAISGTGKIEVAIEKDGIEGSVAKALLTLYDIKLKKKDLTIHPTKPLKVYTKGESMPALTSTNIGLVVGDTLPDGIDITLLPLPGTEAALPASSDKIDAIGKWKMTYASTILSSIPEAFKENYNVTLKDYSVDSSYVFETMSDVLPDTWISITPNANGNGWNKEDVTITPTALATAQGYTTVILYDASGAQLKSGSSIVYELDSTNSDGDVPIVALSNGTLLTSKKTLRTVKIDTTLPTLSAVVEKADVWVKNKKKVTLTVGDELSGIDSVSVTLNAKAYTVTKVSDTSYSFEADEVGTYALRVVDKAGNEFTKNLAVSKIDKSELKLDAQLQAINPEDSKTQDILVTRQGADAGITSFKVYHSVDDGTYVELADLSQVTNPLTYVAKMNGYYKFELVDKLNETVTSKVQVSEVTPPMPNTIIKAVIADGKNTPYVINTWTNEKVVLTLSNGNAEIKDAVTWEVQTKDSSTWENVVGNTYEVDSDTWIKGQYSFRGTSSLGAVESVASVMNVNIDKVKPSLPSISNEAQYKEETIFDENVTMEGSVVEKESGINQSIYYKIGATGTWELMIANQLLIETNGEHEVSFKVVDDAGNESDVKGPLVVHLNKTTPTISFKLNDKALNYWLNKVTLGYFFKETVAVEISSDTPADIWYIVDTSETQTMPLSSDIRWAKGTTTNIVPDKKAIIYAKAVTNAGKESISSTTYYVYADKTNPNITFEANENWTNETDVEVTINDALSGIDDKTVTYSAKDIVNEKVSVVNGKVKLTLVDGEYDVVVKGNDHSGNEATGTTRVKIDTANPVIKDVKGNTTGWANSRTIALHASDALSGLAVGYPKVTGAQGPVTVVNDGSGKYHFIISANGSYSIEVKDQAGNTATSTYVEDKIGEDQSGLQVLAESAGESIASTEWTKEDISFKIGGGSISNPVTGYQVAITSGTQPQESDWNTLSDPTNNKHLVSSEQRGKSFYFRSLPDKVTSTAFVVNIDKTAPTNVAITLSKKNSGPMARMFNLMSFGNWLKEEQAVSLSATDNLSSASELKMYYAEEKNGVMGQWKLDPKTLSYRDVDIKLHAKAVDLAGNESVASEIVQIDLLPPTILGVKDQSVYKQYYLPRFISVSDEGSGVKSATYTKDGGSPISINVEEKFTDAGVYKIEAEDNAGNTVSITFKIVPLPDLEDIDGSDESKDIIDQIQKELDEIKSKIDNTEAKEYEEWLKDANDKWDSLRKTIIENDDKTSKVEGVGDTNFDPNVELIVDPIEESTLPKLPRKALYSYDVYLRKGTIVIQPNGDVKVYLPYPDKEAPIVYEIDENGKVREIPAQKEGDSVVFVTNDLKKYAISNIEQDLEIIKVPGPDGDLDTDDDVIANPNDKGELPVKNPDGSVTLPNGGSVTYPNDKVIQTPDGGKLLPDGSLILPDGTEYDPEGNLKPKPDVKPDPKPEVDKDLNIDSDGDGKADVNVDVDCDGKADINIDTNNDGLPDINIDTTGDGKPNYNVDLDDDLTADLNIGPIRWKTNKCVSGGCVLYCTSTFYKPYLNIDTDGDMRPDVSIDMDGNRTPDINIDLDGDYIPDLYIDSNGDGEADINIDDDGDGYPDRNLALMKYWKPELDVNSPLKYDTMSGIEVDPSLTPDTWKPSGNGSLGNTNGSTTPAESENTKTGIGGSLTGDSVSRSLLWVVLIISGITTFISYRLRKHLKQKG